MARAVLISNEIVQALTHETIDFMLGSLLKDAEYYINDDDEINDFETFYESIEFLVHVGGIDDISRYCSAPHDALKYNRYKRLEKLLPKK